MVLYICVGDFRFPWSFRIWKGKGSKSVTLLALDLIRTVPADLTQGREVWVYADGGFDAAVFIRSVHACGFVCVVGVLGKAALSWDKRHLAGHPAPWGLPAGAVSHTISPTGSRCIHITAPGVMRASGKPLTLPWSKKNALSRVETPNLVQGRWIPKV